MSGPDARLPKHFTASGLVLVAGRRLLLVDHRALGVWLYPGGHIDERETPDQAVVREVQEETGLSVEIVGADHGRLSHPATDVWALATPYRVLVEFIDDRQGPHYHVDLIYPCRPVTEVTVNGYAGLPDMEQRLPAVDVHAVDEVSAAGFFTEDEAMSLDLFPNFRLLLADVFSDDGLWAAAVGEPTPL